MQAEYLEIPTWQTVVEERTFIIPYIHIWSVYQKWLGYERIKDDYRVGYLWKGGLLDKVSCAQDIGTTVV